MSLTKENGMNHRCFVSLALRQFGSVGTNEVKRRICNYQAKYVGEDWSPKKLVSHFDLDLSVAELTGLADRAHVSFSGYCSLFVQYGIILFAEREWIPIAVPSSFNSKPLGGGVRHLIKFNKVQDDLMTDFCKGQSVTYSSFVRAACDYYLKYLGVELNAPTD